MYACMRVQLRKSISVLRFLGFTVWSADNPTDRGPLFFRFPAPSGATYPLREPEERPLRRGGASSNLLLLGSTFSLSRVRTPVRTTLARFAGARLRRRGISGRPTRNFREELRLVFYSSTKTSGSFVASLRSTRRQRANSSTSGLSRTL